MSVAAIYLSRAAEGLEPVKRFAASYHRHPPGMAHDLVLICKGYASDAAAATARAQFDGPATVLRMTDDGFDIGAYIAAAAKLEHDTVCFLNTFSEIAADDWLGKLAHPLDAARIGIAGAMGSYESVRDTIDLVARVSWLCNQGLPFDREIADGFRWILTLYAPWWMEQSRLRRLLRRARPRRIDPGDLTTWRAHWTRVTGYSSDLGTWLDGFPCFPNPHIRSNGFAVRRALFNAVVGNAPPTKETAMHFESGMDGYTARIARLGLACVVVDNRGRPYDILEWASSGTFRLGQQEQLLLTDNQSRGFAAMDEGSRRTHANISWGEYAGPVPRIYRDLGFPFARSDDTLKKIVA